MKVTDLRLLQKKNYIDITLVTSEGEFVFTFGRIMARRLMRAIFGSIGVDSRLGTRDWEEGDR